MGGNNRMEESVDGGKGGCVGPDFIVYDYPVSSYRPPHSPFSQSVYLIPLLLYHPPPHIVHLTLLFLSLCTSFHFSFTTRLR